MSSFDTARENWEFDPDDFLCYCIFEWIEEHHPEGLRWKKASLPS